MQERLQKIIAAAGIASRRSAEEIIVKGEVTVDGAVVTQLGAKADPELNHIKVRGKLINPGLGRERKRYLLVNKPRGYLSSLSDPQRRPLVTYLIPTAERHGLRLLGGLNPNTEGWLRETEEGALPRLWTGGGAVPKVYREKERGPPADEDINRRGRGARRAPEKPSPAGI